MKLLFERLDSTEDGTTDELIAQSLDQIVSVQYISDPDAPPGILNFGLPRAVDATNDASWQRRYSKLVEERIRQFEPRLAHVRATVTGERVAVTGELRDREQTPFSWSSGG